VKHARTHLAALAMLALAATHARAQLWATPAQLRLWGARTAPVTRARLAAFADSMRAKSPGQAADAYGWIGRSHFRSGHADSARAAYGAAYAISESPEDAFGLAEAMLRARSRADSDSAARFLAARPLEDPEGANAANRAWRAWAHSRLDRAAASPELDAVRTELASPAIPRALREHWTRRLWPGTPRWSADADPPGARPLEVPVGAGGPLGAWLFPVGRAGAPLVVLLGELFPGATPESLAVQLHRAGFSLAVLDPRGVRASRGGGFDYADDWNGREDSLMSLSARDLAAAITAASAATGADPRRIAAGAVGPLALAAARAAKADGRVGALLFVDAALDAVDRGPFIATLADAGTPTWFQTGQASVVDNQVVDGVVSRLPGRQCRVEESRAGGAGFALFSGGPVESRRIIDWLRESWSSRPATRPRRPR
jgi:hypothetical protein